MIDRAGWLGGRQDERVSKPKILILGGTGEARLLAEKAVARFGDKLEIITSQAGVTRSPKPVAGRLVRGGFGGISGLQDFIEREQIEILIDATHAYASTISDNAYIACIATKTPRLTLVRPPWEIPQGARVVHVPDMKSAAMELAERAKRVLVTTGRKGLDAFSDLAHIWFLVRMIEAPEKSLPLASHQILLDRPPYDLATEQALLKTHGIDTLLSKDSGGDATFAKIQAAAEADLTILLIKRPDLVPGDWVGSVEDCLNWLQAQV